MQTVTIPITYSLANPNQPITSLFALQDQTTKQIQARVMLLAQNVTQRDAF